MTLSRPAGEGLASRLIDAFPGFCGICTAKGAWLDDNGRANDASAREAGHEEGALVWDLLPWSRSTELQERVRDAIERSARGERVTFRASIAVRGGGPADHELTFGPIVDSEGKATMVAFFGTDITERTRAEAALREREEQLVALSDATIEALFVHQGGVILATNKAARELYRLPPDGAVGRPLLDYVAPESLELVMHHVKARSSEPYEAAGRRADGTTFPAAVQARTVTFRGQPARLAAIRDLTELRKMQASLAFADRMASVGALAAGVAHEINNPLTFISVGLDDVLGRLEAGFSDPASVREISEILRDVQEGARRVAAIVRDLKSFSRADDEATGPTELGPVIRYAARMAASEIKHRARLDLDLDLDLVPPVTGSDTRLGQVFLNLLVNAAQATPVGAADKNTITVSARTERDRVIVSVSDTGEGIAPHILERIFDPFASTKAHGMGLGLAICHGIVTRLGGSIDVESSAGRGTTFRVTLPVAHEAQTGAAGREPPAALPGPARKPRVLIVDDEPILLRTAARVLGDVYDIAVAQSAKEALVLLERGENFDALLCDLSMPEMTGMQLFERIAERWPDVAGRVVFVTGGVFTRQAESFLATTRRPCIEKPFSVEAVRQAVGRVIAGA